MTKYTGFLGKIRMIKPVHIGVICLAFVLSIFSTLSFADNAVTGSGTECVYSTLNTYTGPSTIKANWDPNTINLYWYNDEQKLTVQTAANTCNYDSGIALPSTNPTKTGYTFSGWEVIGGVPTGYTLLEYIQSSGTQYINTGITSSGIGLKTEVSLQLTTSDTAEHAIIGRNSGGGYEIYFLSGRIGAYHASGQSAYVSVNYTSGVTYKVISEMTSNSITQSVNGMQSTYSGTVNTTAEAEVCLFRHNSNYAISAKVYYVNIWKNGVLVRNFIPAKNPSNVVGMYDTVSGTFFTNAGTGTFTAGPAVQ